MVPSDRNHDYLIGEDSLHCHAVRVESLHPDDEAKRNCAPALGRYFPPPAGVLIPVALRLVGPARLRRKRVDQKTAFRRPQPHRDGVALAARDANFNRLQRANSHAARDIVNELAGRRVECLPISHIKWQLASRLDYPFLRRRRLKLRRWCWRLNSTISR